VLAILAALGSSFDCASATEVDMVMALGVSPDRIIYANPCKMPAHLARVRDCGVGLTTFDSVAELHKIYELAPEMKVVLRLRADDPDARCVLGNKFGAEPPEIEPLLTAAKHLGIHVEGVAFHVGSGATNPRAFRVALERARLAFDIAERIGLPPLKLVDIGGGFSGSVRTVAATNDSDVTLTEVAKTVNASLEEFFPESSGVRIISEPGRYFAEATTTLATMVFSRRIRSEEDGSVAKGGDTHQYFVSDGLYGMMNCLLYDHATVAPRPLLMASKGCDGGTGGIGPRRPSTVFGPTCDGLDTVLRDYELPEMDVGDWLLFPNMVRCFEELDLVRPGSRSLTRSLARATPFVRQGAYTLCGASKFNGINAVDVPTFYVYS